MQIDPLPELPPSADYEIIITAIDVFSRYAFAYPVSNSMAVNTAKVIIDIMTRHAYLPTLIITCKRNVFLSQVKHEVTEYLGINFMPLQNMNKHSGSIHATMKTSLRMASVEYRKQWHNYLPDTILNNNTTYHSSKDCEPSRVFHGKVAHNFFITNMDYDLFPISHLQQTLQNNYSAEPKFSMTKPRKMSCSRTSNTRCITTKKQKLHL